MKFTIEKSDFLEGLNHVARVIAPNSLFEILKGIKLELSSNNLVLKASDSLVSVEFIIDAYKGDKEIITIEEEGQVVLPSRNFIEIIRAFTRLASTEAGSHLTAYLKTLNRKQEKNSANPPDPQVVLAVVQSLALLGDKVAFDDLLYATYQNYPDIVVSAAKEALSKLKW